MERIVKATTVHTESRCYGMKSSGGDGLPRVQGIESEARDRLHLLSCAWPTTGGGHRVLRVDGGLVSDEWILNCT